MSEKHLRLTHEEFLAINNLLTEAELRVYLYLRTLDPFGDRKLTIDTSVISEQLGLVRRTVQKCLKSLESKKLIDWEVVVSKISTHSANVGSPSERRIAKRTQDRLSERRIAKANVGSPRRTQDRQQPLEVNQGNDSTTPHPSSSFINLSQSDQDDNFMNFKNKEAAWEVAHQIAKSQKKSFDGNPAPIAQTSHQQINDSSPDCIDGLANMPTDSTTPIDGDLFRRRVEDFVLKSLKFSPRDRTAYFSRFTPENWQDWEAKYKATLTQPSSMYKPFVPEQVEVANPDSPAVQNAIAEIRKSLGIKT